MKMDKARLDTLQKGKGGDDDEDKFSSCGYILECLKSEEQPCSISHEVDDSCSAPSLGPGRKLSWALSLGPEKVF